MASCSIEQSSTSISSSSLISRRGLTLRPEILSLPIISKSEIWKPIVLNSRPMLVSSFENFGYLSKKVGNPDKNVAFLSRKVVNCDKNIGSLSRKVGKFDKNLQCKAFEAERSQPLDLSNELAKNEGAQKLQIGIYFGIWWSLNVVFNIYNKKVLNVFPYPWLTSTLSLAAGSLIMLFSWAARIAEAPKTDVEFWKSLLPVWYLRILI
ncbi:secondary carrier transporter [Lithospermum erythrorhizon]|uniref:Secondary carrier transporter n=1 Tax=Lithospermum erythrorhizon TaxID=34254 RepID=A0AAV3NV81_LITER